MSVDPSTSQGDVTIATNRKEIAYVFPISDGTSLTQGGTTYLQHMPTSLDPPGNRGGGFDSFQDVFSYTVADTAGAQANAQVQVTMQNVPKSKVRLLPNYDEAKEIGIDGKPGYHLKIRKTFGENAPNIRALPKTQLWQRNEQNLVFVFVDTRGKVQMEAQKSRILADTNNIPEGSKTPIRITDTLALKTKPNVDRVALILETVVKTGGLNKPDFTLPVPRQQPWEVTREDHKRLLMQMNARFGTTNLITKYVFVNKPLLEELHQKGHVPDNVFQGIRSALKNTFGIEYATLPKTFEYYEIHPLGKWRYPS